MAFETGKLRYLYCGSNNVEADLTFFQEALGAELLWRFSYNGNDVAAVRLGAGPPLLLADHRESPSVLPIWEVTDLDSAESHLKKKDFDIIRRVEVPDGPAILLKDLSGNEIALMQVTRPEAAEGMARSFEQDRFGGEQGG